MSRADVGRERHPPSDTTPLGAHNLPPAVEGRLGLPSPMGALSAAVAAGAGVPGACP
jgi:hypothetical protein